MPAVIAEESAVFTLRFSGSARDGGSSAWRKAADWPAPVLVATLPFSRTGKKRSDHHSKSKEPAKLAASSLFCVDMAKAGTDEGRGFQ